jgi:predicted RNase H-like nuclease (RuvC/YqgF family)
MADFSIDVDGARAILSTYRDVHDTPHANGFVQVPRAKLQQKNRDLESELNSLKEKYLVLQRELINRDKKLETLNNQLIDKTIYMTRLQEDFENAIEQLGSVQK